ncbi:uncharacterized protein LOC132280775 isoform X2 [Cornus florida]|nr:uncharacterized protein LOC132280775 isoform X2 [Cornus florida]
MKSLSQRSKIEELEAQLQEAEDIVRDLREELSEVQAELEKVRNNKLRHLDECDAIPEETALENRVNTCQSAIFLPSESKLEYIRASKMENSTLDWRKEGHKCCITNDSCMEKTCVCSHDLPSIIMRSKEPELYRNGCTQRIRAFGRNLLDEELSFSREIDDIQNEASDREYQEGKGVCTIPTHKADNTCTTEKKVVHSDNSCYQVQSVARSHRKRKRATRYKKITTPSCRYLSDLVTGRDQASDISFSKIHPSSIDNNAQSGKEHSKMGPLLSSDTTETGIPSGFSGVTESEAEFVKACSGQNIIDRDEALIDKLVPTGQENGCAESSGVLVSKIDLEKLDVPSVDSESKASDKANGISSQPVNDRIIKYTFQRKRKKDSFSSPDRNTSPVKSTLEREIEDKQNGSLEPQKLGSTIDSSRESRRIAQVARQLISLSEKKWWQ